MPQQVSPKYLGAISECFRSSSSRLKGFLIEHNSACGLTASNNIALLIAKQGRPLTIAEDLIIPVTMEACKLANIYNPESVLCSIPLPNNTIIIMIIITIIIRRMMSNPSLLNTCDTAVDETYLTNQSVLLGFVRYIKHSRIREALL